MKPKRVACIGIAVAVAVGFCGCVTIRRGELPEAPWPLAAAQAKRSVSVVLTTDLVTMNGVPIDVPIDWVSSARERVREIYRNSGLFTGLLMEYEPADLRSEVHLSGVRDEITPLSVLCGLTLTLVPTRIVDRLTMRTELKNAKGGVVWSVEKSETLVHWLQAFLVVAFPFEDEDGGAQRLLRDLTRATLDEAHAKGVL